MRGERCEASNCTAIGGATNDGFVPRSGDVVKSNKEQDVCWCSRKKTFWWELRCSFLMARD